MRVLYIAPRIPFPPEGRETVRPYHHLRQIALRHDVDLLCFSGGGFNLAEARERLLKICHRVMFIPHETPQQHPGRLTNFFARRPLALRRYYRKDLMLRLEDIAESERYDLVFVYSAAMAPYLEAFPEVPRIIDLVEVGSLRWLEYAEYSRFPATAVYRAEASRLMRVEMEAADQVQHVLLASEREARHFRNMRPDHHDRISSLKTPVNPRDGLKGPWAADPTILFTGNLDHFPNLDGAQHLLKEIFPRIKKLCRNTRLIIAGKNPPPELRELADQAGAVLSTEDRHLPRHFRDAWLTVAPQRVAHGVRNEILEALALGQPVVATEEAVAGLDLLLNRDIMVESSPARFAAEVVRLLENPHALQSLGSRARRAVHNNYSHWSTAIRLEEVVNQAALEEIGTWAGKGKRPAGPAG